MSKVPRNVLFVVGIVLVVMGGVMARSALMMALDIKMVAAAKHELPPDDPRAVADFEERRDDLTLDEQLALAQRMGLRAEAARINAEIERTWREPLLLAGAGSGVLLFAIAALFVFRKALSAGDPEDLEFAAAPEDHFRNHRAGDPHLSHPALIHFVHTLFKRATLASVGLEPWDPLEAFLDPKARRALEDQNSNIRRLGDLVVGDIVLTMADLGTKTCLDAEIRGYHQEETIDGRIRAAAFECKWRMRRPVEATSPPANALLTLGCADCGAPLPHQAIACGECGAEIDRDHAPWRLEEILGHEQTPLVPPPLSAALHGSRSKAPLFRDAQLDAELHHYEEEVESFDMEAFLARVVDIFNLVQGSWADGSWRRIAPWCTPPASDAIRMHHDAYEINGLRHVHEAYDITRIDLARVERDPMFVWITVRIWWMAAECVADGDGNAVDGVGPVLFERSEYWTFQRAGTAGTAGPLDRCPRCEADITDLDDDDTCPGCSAWLGSGAYSFVLARRETVPGYETRRQGRLLEA